MYCTIHRNANSMTSLVSMLLVVALVVVVLSVEQVVSLMDDIFSMFGDVFGGRGGGFGGFGGGGHQAPKYRGTDLRLKVRLSLQEVATGVTKKFKVRKDVPCEHCHGSGAEEG